MVCMEISQSRCTHLLQHRKDYRMYFMQSASSRQNLVQGMVQSWLCCQADVKRLEAAVDSASGDVDIFLTCEWPAGITAAAPAALQPQSVAMSAGAIALYVLSTCRGLRDCRQITLHGQA